MPYIPQLYPMRDFRDNVQQVEVTFVSETKTYIGTIRRERVTADFPRYVYGRGESDTPHGAADQAIANYKDRYDQTN
jgi:hypothetical protein